MNEPNHMIPDPQAQWCPVLNGQRAPTHDVFDEFLRLTGGPAAPKGGHADSVKRHEAKTAIPVTTEEGRYVSAQQSIILPVFRPNEPDPEEHMMPAPQKVRKAK